MFLQFLYLKRAALPLDQAFVSGSFFVGYGGEGASSDGNNLWVLDDTNGQLRKYDVSGGGFVSAGTVVPSVLGSGLAWDGSGLWMTAGTSDTYTKVSHIDGSTIASFFDRTGIV